MIRLTRQAWLALLVIGALIGAACGGADETGSGDSAESGEITLMAYAGIFKDNYMKAVVEPFMEKYPDIKVNYLEGQNSAQMLAQLRSQKNDPQVDVVIMDVSIAKAGNDEGIFQPLDPEIVTNLADLYDQAKTPDNFGPSVTFDNLVLIYNTDLVDTPPTSWSELWNQEYKGKVIIPAPPDIQGLALTIITNNMEGADYTDTIDPAIAKLKELAPLVQTYDPQPDQYTLVTSGQAALAVGWNARAQIYSDQSEGKMGVALPQEGSIFQKNTINLVKGSKNSRAAQTFINYALSPEAQASFTETMFYAPVNSKAEVSEEALQRTASSQELVDQMLPVDWVYLTQVRDQWLERWRKEVIGG